MNLSSVRIALRGIVANKLRSVLTTLGIMIGVGSVIVLVAVGSGSAAATRQNLEALGIEHAHRASRRLRVRRPRRHAEPPGTRSPTADVTALAEQGQRARRRRRSCRPSTSAARPSSTTARPTRRAPSRARRPTSASVRNYPVEWGTWFTQQQYDQHANVVVLGLTDVKDLVGQQADGSALVGQQVLIGGKSFTVIGVFKSKGTNGFQDQDSIAIMPLTTARDDVRRQHRHRRRPHRAGDERQDGRRRAERDHRGARRPAPRLELDRLQRAEPAVAAARRSRATTGRSRCCSPRSPRSRCSSAASAS